ncbi:site-specific integrase [Poseidonibacter antarcticus]|uniref:site-specific integrase n=1 Tax=Poseidonibacter antarcticus TaxID=2478538 RepID=UPI000EF4A198|nr:site-specific integrase [Poseidonibacter antarcticus]
MANLKGSSFEKQVKDIHHRLSAFGEKRHGRTDKQTHSSALSIKRAEMSKSFAEYCTNKGLEGKLNIHMNNETVKEFLNYRTQDLAKSSCENYVRAFSSMLEGLEKSNVDMLVTKDVFEEKMMEIRQMPDINPIQGRAINEADKLINNLYEKSYEIAVVAQTQLELGFRVSEAFEVVGNIDKYYNDGKLIGVIGKGNHEYTPKNITSSLLTKIKLVDNLPTQRTYANHLKAYDVTPHDFRYTFVKNEVEKRLELGQEYKTILKEISKEINHSREEMTNYYLKRA